MNKKYHIVILCGADPYKGPGIIALDLYKKFLIDGHSVKIISNHNFITHDKNIIPYNNTTISNQFYNLCKKIFYKIFGKPTSSKYIMLSLKKEKNYTNHITKYLNEKTDVFIYMFSHGYLFPEDLERIYKKTNAPILYFMMDSASVTGGCHFAWDCKQYIEFCGNCPGIASNNKKDLTFKNMLQKYKIYNKIQLYSVFATERQRLMLIESLLFKGKKIYHTHIPIDMNFFPIESKTKIRVELNYSIEQSIIFVAAASISDERKGMKLLVNSLNILSKKLSTYEKGKILFVIAGNQFNLIFNSLSLKYQYLGYLSQENFAKTLHCADLFLCPSIEDSGPMMINQAFMAGVPVVAFDMGIASEIVQTGITGYKAKLGDVNDFAYGINYILNLEDAKKDKLSNNCREFALTNFTVERVANNFYNIFDNILGYDSE